MTNQSQPLTLKLSNGQDVSIASAKSVLQHTENGQQHRCAIVQGPNGAAIYNAEGDVEINGAPSSAHWLQPGDTLQFGSSLSASVEQLGVVIQELDSLLEETQPATAAELDLPTPVQNLPAPDSQIATAQATLAETLLPTPATSEADQDTFTPATSAASFTPELETAPAPVMPETPEVAVPDSTTPVAAAPDQPTTAADLAIPAATAATLAALGAAIVSAEPSTDSSAEPVDAEAELTGFNPIAQAIAEPTAVPADEPAAASPTTGFAAELMARIQADESNDQQHESYENETVGTPISETTHSPLAADGPSFSTPADEPTSISSLIPELPSNTAFSVVESNPDDQPASPETSASNPVETSTGDSTERQSQSSSVSALLERMKEEGQWGGISEEEAEEEASTTSEATETPVLDAADEDVQSYMSQLLSRMRDPNDEQRPAKAAATPTPAQAKPEVVEAPKPVGLLKPEEYVPKTKARRLDSLQDMRALANTQTRSAIDRSQAKQLEASLGSYHLLIIVAGGVAAAIVLALNFFGYLAFSLALVAVALIALTSVTLYFCKGFFSKLLAPKQKNVVAGSQETAEATHDVA